MAKKMSPFAIANAMGDAADKKSKKAAAASDPNEPDADDLPPPKAKKPLNGKQIGAIKAKGGK